jgi:6-phosphofructokinase 1
MNAAIRSAVRSGLAQGWSMYGVRHGFRGLVEGDVLKLGAREVGGIIGLPGTFLHTARYPDFELTATRQKALARLEKQGIDALLVIGGNGSQTGAHELSRSGFPVMGIASTIDNDLYGSDICIGVDTALDVALESIDRVRATASSLDRAFLVEVMGRNHGYLALMSGIAGGAESIVIPEIPVAPEQVAAELQAGYRRGKKNAIAVVAEGASCNAGELEKYFQLHGRELGFELRLTRLGHVQRGGVPGAFDRLLATRLAVYAVERLGSGKRDELVGLVNGQLASMPLAEAAGRPKQLDTGLLETARMLAR